MAATHGLVRDRLPRLLAPVAEPLANALLDEPVRRALGLPPPPRAPRLGVRAALGARKFAVRHLLRPRTESVFAGDIATVTYPDGYEIATLGPDALGPDTLVA